MKTTIFMVASLISNCARDRLNYIEHLEKYIQVDIYGHCGQPCSQLGHDQNCRIEISKKYKFFLAFENSICKDYITEKFFETLRYNIIPITMGGGPYNFYVISVLFLLKFL
jgi:hypothetical protein